MIEFDKICGMTLKQRLAARERVRQKEQARRAACFDSLVSALERCENLLQDMRVGIRTEGCAEEEILLETQAALNEARNKP